MAESETQAIGPRKHDEQSSGLPGWKAEDEDPGTARGGTEVAADSRSFTQTLQDGEPHSTVNGQGLWTHVLVSVRPPSLSAPGSGERASGLALYSLSSSQPGVTSSTDPAQRHQGCLETFPMVTMVTSNWRHPVGRTHGSTGSPRYYFSFRQRKTGRQPTRT